MSTMTRLLSNSNYDYCVATYSNFRKVMNYLKLLKSLYETYQYTKILMCMARYAMMIFQCFKLYKVKCVNFFILFSYYFVYEFEHMRLFLTWSYEVRLIENCLALLVLLNLCRYENLGWVPICKAHMVSLQW